MHIPEHIFPIKYLFIFLTEVHACQLYFIRINPRSPHPKHDVRLGAIRKTAQNSGNGKCAAQIIHDFPSPSQFAALKISTTLSK